MEASERVRRVTAVEEKSPFLPLGQGVRIAFLAYLLIYRTIIPLMVALSNDGARDLLALRFTAEFLYTCLLAYPFIFYRREYGWLHPLVLPILWQLGKALVKDPMMLVMPFSLPLINFTVETNSGAAVLSMSNIDLAWTRLNLTLVYCVAQATYLAFFLFGPTFKVPKYTLYRPNSVAIPALAFIGVMMGMASVVVISKGGVAELIVAMRGGRSALFEGYGQYVNAALVAPIIAIAWFGYEKRGFASPVFILGLIVALLTSLIVSGSRSSVILPMLALILLWWRQKGRPLVLPTLLAALAGTLVLSAFGAMRQDWQSTTLDLSVLEFDRLGETLQSGYDEINSRNDEEPDLAVMAGAHVKGFLWGRSYANAAVFWIPRGIWEDKPVGIDRYNMWLNFNDNIMGTAPREWGTWGIPVNAEMEAYWNFGLFGVVVVFGLLGMVNASLAKAAHIYRNVPIFWAIYVYIVLNLLGTSRSVADLLRALAVIVVFMIISGIIRIGKNHGAESETLLRPSAS